jgi:hypothetical protein
LLDHAFAAARFSCQRFGVLLIFAAQPGKFTILLGQLVLTLSMSGQQLIMLLLLLIDIRTLRLSQPLELQVTRFSLTCRPSGFEVAILKTFEFFTLNGSVLIPK